MPRNAKDSQPESNQPEPVANAAQPTGEGRAELPEGRPAVRKAPARRRKPAAEAVTAIETPAAEAAPAIEKPTADEDKLNGKTMPTGSDAVPSAETEAVTPNPDGAGGAADGEAVSEAEGGDDTPAKRRRRRRSRKKPADAESAGTDASPDDASTDAGTEDAGTEGAGDIDRSTGGAAASDAEPGAGRDDSSEPADLADSEVEIDPDSPFAQMDLSPETLAAVTAMGFTVPTAIQEQTIPPMMDWRDVIAQAPTGTGKTVAFGIPIIEHFDPELSDVQALILAPTRELALQISDELRALAQNRPQIRIATIYGGQRIDKQLDELKHRPQIIVATPGRLIDHLNRRTVSLGSVRTVVLDEADRMLDMGFVRDVRKILDKMPRAWQVTMFSATMSRAVMDISWIYQRDVIELKVVPEAENKPQITQYSIEVGAHRRIEVIAELMKKHNYQRAIVFCNRKHVTDYVARRLSALNVRSASIHGDIQQSVREKTLASFRAGTLRVLVATDVAARGIDVEGVDAVFNYDIPDENEYYVHRIGRTGRARQAGVAYTFTTMMTQPKLDEIMRYTKCEITPLAVE